MSARASDLPASPVTSDRPTAIRAKNSGGPNFRANRVSGRATNTRPIVATVPPMKDPMAAMAKAGPARPCLAIWYPSRQVTTLAASPGTLRSTEVIVPPYMAP